MYNYYQNNFQTPADERIWVQSKTSAEAYLVAPNGFVRLWDSQKPYFYEKRTDAAGRPMPIEIYSYEKISDPACDDQDLKVLVSNLTKRIEKLEKENRHDTESDADDSAIQPV